VTLAAPKGADDRAPGLGAAGYQPKFLREEVPLPGAKPAVKRDYFAVDGRPVFDYTHFSLALSQSRRYARWVAYNIDGGRVVKAGIKRAGWKRDGRIPNAAQIGDELYGNSIIDRGHLAKREDLLWGTPEEASRANADSFFFTNASPQHKEFNEGIWKQLEDAIFRETDVADLKVSVFTGPIYRDDDRTYRGVRIPRDFWKIIVWVDEEKGLRASAFVMTQDDLIANLEALGLEKFKVYQVRVAEVESRTGLTFAKLGAADTQPQAAGPEALGETASGKPAAGSVRLVESALDLSF
jgi:endonuclease G